MSQLSIVLWCLTYIILQCLYISIVYCSLVFDAMSLCLYCLLLHSMSSVCRIRDVYKNCNFWLVLKLVYLVFFSNLRLVNVALTLRNIEPFSSCDKTHI